MRQVYSHTLLDAENHQLDQLPILIKRHNRPLTEQTIEIFVFPFLFGLFLHKRGGGRKNRWVKMAEPNPILPGDDFKRRQP